MKRTTRRASLLIVLVALTLSLALAAGCSRASQQPEDKPEITVNLTIAPNPPVVGPAELLVEIQAADGTPIRGASIAAKADMSHAGMQPVLGQSVANGDGYIIPIAWTMAGDWFVTLEITLADGATFSRRFDMNVGGNMDMNMGES